MARGEYGRARVGNDTRQLPQVTGTYRPYALLFRERLDELDKAIQQADSDFATKYQGDVQSRFVFTNWLPFVRDWNATREWLLGRLIAGQITGPSGDALRLAHAAARFNDLVRSAIAGYAFETTAPAVTIKGTVGAEPKPLVERAIDIGAGVLVFGIGYLWGRSTRS